MYRAYRKSIGPDKPERWSSHGLGRREHCTCNRLPVVLPGTRMVGQRTTVRKAARAVISRKCEAHMPFPGNEAGRATDLAIDLHARLIRPHCLGIANLFFNYA